MKKIKILLYILFLLFVTAMGVSANDRPERSSSARAVYGKSNSRSIHNKAHKFRHKPRNRKVQAKNRYKADWKKPSKPAKGTRSGAWRVKRLYFI